MAAIKYFIIVLSLSLFAVMNVWQNIEVMKIKLNYKKLTKTEGDIIKKNDRLRYEIEKYKRISLIENNAEALNIKRINKDDFIVLIKNNESKQ